MAKTLQEVLASQDWPLLERVNGWILEQKDHLLWFSLTARDGQRFRVLIECLGYPQTAPSVMFVNEQNSKTDPRAWPYGGPLFMQVVKLPPAECFLCMPLTREGLAHHAEWRGKPDSWNPETTTILDLLNYLQRLLTSTDYIGRRT